MVEMVHSGLTTNDAAFIDEARSQGRRFIHQPYELYSDENHETWRRLYARMLPVGGNSVTRIFCTGSIRCVSIRSEFRAWMT
jgi:phenylalanine-4-hydroxylase